MKIYGFAKLDKNVSSKLFNVEIKLTEIDLILFSSVLQAVGGNIMNGSPVSDLNPLLLCLGATLHFRRAGIFSVIYFPYC